MLLETEEEPDYTGEQEDRHQREEHPGKDSALEPDLLQVVSKVT